MAAACGAVAPCPAASTHSHSLGRAVSTAWSRCKAVRPRQHVAWVSLAMPEHAVGRGTEEGLESGAPLHADRPQQEQHPLRARVNEMIQQMQQSTTMNTQSDPQVTGVSGTGGYWELLHSVEQEQTVMAGRAPSAMDAGALRRKGHLKEQDSFIDFMLAMHENSGCLEVMTKVEGWIEEHRKDPRRSRLRRMLPRLGTFFTSLHLVDAFKSYDAQFALSKRKYIPPNFAEMRHILDIAQVHASAATLKLITFDADGTLYEDGHHFTEDNNMIELIIKLLSDEVQVAIVTAAAYPGEADKFEARLLGLLDAFRQRQLPADVTNRFHVVGGETNYLLSVNPETKRLEFVHDDAWMLPSMKAWDEKAIQQMLKDALTILVDSAQRLNLQVEVIQKERCVGIVPHQTTIYEVLEDIALTVQNQLQSDLPFCAFNGGNDVFVDVGSKSLGLQCLMAYLGTKPHETIHVGDRFTLSGNDTAARDVCSVLWVANPEETAFFVKLLLSMRMPNHAA